MLSLGVLGSTGRMGLHVLNIANHHYSDRVQVAGKVARGGSMEALLKCDVIVDFSSPEAVGAAVDAALELGAKKPAWVIGSTGLSDGLKDRLGRLAKNAPVLVSSNFSMGVLALDHAIRSVAPVLTRLGYHASIIERHHHHKKDAPSGTALLLESGLKASGTASRQTLSVRAGEIIGEHEVAFYGPADEIRFTHRAQDRTVFARGAIEAALWLVGQKPGAVLSMADYFKAKVSGGGS